jgi:hypothetical protein
MEIVLNSLIQGNVHTKIRATTTDNASEMPPAFEHIRNELREQYGVSLEEG